MFWLMRKNFNRARSTTILGLFLLPTSPSPLPPTPAAAAAKSLQSCPTLCDPIDGSPLGSLSLGFSRQEYWSGLPFPSPMHESEKWKWSRSVVPQFLPIHFPCAWKPFPNIWELLNTNWMIEELKEKSLVYRIFVKSLVTHIFSELFLYNSLDLDITSLPPSLPVSHTCTLILNLTLSSSLSFY